ncbi:hypothetical protein ACIQX4_16815 [Rhodococcus erythropolis]|uniref:hypothetical protein n=1 Tax=uncultured Rhodococcus sp. TaxID=194249 RepID=UPI002604AB7B|nr:hypothetical protein [uncultured Rhodococcus sp.]
MTINSIIPTGKSAVGKLVGAPFHFASSLRMARVFHPHGIELKGMLKPATPLVAGIGVLDDFRHRSNVESPRNTGRPTRHTRPGASVARGRRR